MAKAIKEQEKRQSQAKWQDELERVQINKKRSKSTLPLKSTPPNPLNAGSSSD
jgi:hypothetical protein